MKQEDKNKLANHFSIAKNKYLHSANITYIFLLSDTESE